MTDSMVTVQDLFRAQRDLTELLDARNAQRCELICRTWPEIALEGTRSKDGNRLVTALASPP